MKKLTQEELKSLLKYDPLTGDFTRLVSKGGVTVGDVAGCSCKRLGYVRINVNLKSYQSHRLAFLYMTGKFPVNHVDHINRIPSDNRWSNLRECTLSQNQANSSTQLKSFSGFKGVTWDKAAQCYRARISHNKKAYHIGHFDCKQSAALAYNKKAKELFGEFACLNEIAIGSELSK